LWNFHHLKEIGQVNMAKMEFIKKENEDSPGSVERIEVCVRGTGGAPGQEFCIGSGSNFNAAGNFWIEIRYSLNDIPVFYTRSILHYLGHTDLDDLEGELERFKNDERPGFGFGDMLPETSIYLTRKKTSHTWRNEEEETYIDYSLTISADMGAVFGQSSPGERMLDIRLTEFELEDGLRFMHELNLELSEVSQGRHPDPAGLLPGFSDWPFTRQLNRQAYDQISTNYQEKYFENPLLTQACDDWLAELPAGGHILDAGCGHGQPVISRLLEKGFRVTGSDLSPAMLARAGKQFPAVQFWELAITEIEVDSVFDGVCSFSSLLYQDPIDLFHSIHRLHTAIKPGGLLFLYAYDLHPTWRGQPYHMDINHWMWGGNYGLHEVARALEEHGYFKVQKKLDVTTANERKKGIKRWREQARKDHEERVKKYGPEINLPAPDLTKPPSHMAYPYVVVAKRL
jgi:SAM-dependent methyltransferase